jgi:hypothetical protein
MKDRAKFNTARDALIESGLGLDMHEWISYAERTLSLIHALAEAIGSGIESSGAFAYFNDSENEITDYQTARKFIAANILNMSIPDKPMRRPAFAALAAADSACISLAQDLNKLKTEWRSAHSAIRAYAGFNESGVFNVNRATEVIRTVLKRSGYPNISLAISDRHVPVLKGEVLKVRWFKTDATPSARRTIGDFVAAMREVRNDYDLRDDLLELINAEILKFSRMDQNTPVSQRLRDANPSYRFRAMVLEGHTRTTISDYAASPILFEQLVGAVLPQMHVYEDRIGSGSSRRKTGDQLVHESLDTLGDLRRYHYYLESATKPQSERTTIANPYARTAIPRVSLQSRKRLGRVVPYITVQLTNGKQSTYNIEKLGIEEAWRRAVQNYTALVKSGYEALADSPPTKQQVNDMIEWANKNLSGG